MKHLKTLLTAAMLSLAAVSVSAAPLPVYKCEMTNIGPTGWISDFIYIEIDERNGTARVHDYYTENYAGGDAIVVEKFQNLKKRYRLKWTIRNVKLSNSNEVVSRAQFTAALFKANMKLRVDVILSQWDNSPWGEGVCKRIN